MIQNVNVQLKLIFKILADCEFFRSLVELMNIFRTQSVVYLSEILIYAEFFGCLTHHESKNKIILMNLFHIWLNIVE